jgi:hypothetical protein
MRKDSLPIYQVGDDEFYNFKNNYLNRNRITKKGLSEILRLYGLESGERPNGHPGVSVSCDEAHGHGYGCLNFRDFSSAIISRLVMEIEHKNSLLKKIRETSEKTINYLSDPIPEEPELEKIEA